MGENCKHVVAVLHSYFNDKEKTKLDSKSWLKSIILNLSSIEKKYDSKYKLIFRIVPSGVYSHQLIPEKVILENGVIKSSKILSLRSLIENPYRDYVTKKDEEIIKLLGKIHFYHSLYVENVIYSVVLKTLVEQRNLYFGTNIYPIKGLRYKKLKLDWENTEDKYLLKVNINGENLIIASEIFEYSPSENILYQIEPKISNALLKLLLNAKPLSREETAKLYFLLKETGFEVAKPDMVEELEIKEEPVPVLKISYDKERSFLNIEFKVKYDNYYLSPLSEEKSFVYDGLKRVSITRNLEKEENYKKRLIKTNLKHFAFSPSWKYFISLEGYLLEKAYQFLESDIKKLKEEGWKIEYISKLPVFESGDIDFEIKEEDSWWFDVSVKEKLENEEIDLLPFLKKLLKEYNIKKLPKIIFVKYEENKVLRLKKEEVQPIINTIFNLYRKKDTENLKINKAEIHLIEDELINDKEIKRLKIN